MEETWKEVSSPVSAVMVVLPSLTVEGSREDWSQSRACVGGQEQKQRGAEEEVEAGGRHRSAGLGEEKVPEKGMVVQRNLLNIWDRICPFELYVSLLQLSARAGHLSSLRHL